MGFANANRQISFHIFASLYSSFVETDFRDE